MKLYTFGATNTYVLNAPDRTMRAVVVNADSHVLYDRIIKAGSRSNNFAELWAMAEALHVASKAAVVDEEEIEILTDSRTAHCWFGGSVGKKVTDRSTILKMVAGIERLRAHVIVTASWIGVEENLAVAHVLDA